MSSAATGTGTLVLPGASSTRDGAPTWQLSNRFGSLLSLTRLHTSQRRPPVDEPLAGHVVSEHPAEPGSVPHADVMGLAFAVSPDWQAFRPERWPPAYAEQEALRCARLDRYSAG